MQANQHRLSNVWYPPRGLNCWFEIHIVYINRIYRQLATWNTLREHLSLPPWFLVRSMLLIFLYFVVSYYVFTFWVPCAVRYDVRIKRCSVRLYLQLLIEGRISYLHYMRLFAYFNVQHKLWCSFALFFFVLSTLCYQFLYIVHFWLPLRYSLTFIIYKSIVTFTRIKVCSWLTAGSWSW